MEVLALGMSRTGTKSMATALEKLGYRHCAHGFDMFDSSEYTRKWRHLVEAKLANPAATFDREVWDELLGHCSAVTDMPCAIFWQDLCAAYPEAKIVLVERNEVNWLESFQTGVVDTQFSPMGNFTRDYVEPVVGSHLGATSMGATQLFTGAPKNKEAMSTRLRTSYRKHYDDIRANIPSERLLDFQLSQGWRPLCHFLGKDIPDESFPWVNETEALKERIALFHVEKRKELIDTVVTRVLPVFVIAGAVIWYVT